MTALTLFMTLNAHAAPGAQLRIKNDTIGFIKVTINEVEVGLLTPMVEGVLNNVKPGQYDVTFEMANKFRTTYRLSTVPGPPPAPPAEPAAASE